MNKTKYEITIKTDSNKEKYRLGDLIHNQLAGNKDYIENNIILNIDKDKMVRLWVYEECKNNPPIIDELIKGTWMSIKVDVTDLSL